MTREFYELLLSELRMAAYEPGSPERGTDASLCEALTVNEDLMSLGYTLRPDDIARLSVSGSLHGFYDRVKALVPDVTAEPMYPGFPQQVMEMSEAKFRMQQMLHYFSTYGIEYLTGISVSKGWLPETGRSHRDKSDEKLLACKVIELIPEKDAPRAVLKTLLQRRERLTDPELKLVLESAGQCGAETLQSLKVRFKENLDLLFPMLVKSADRETAFAALRAVCGHAGDVLRCGSRYLRSRRFHLITREKKLLVKLLEAYPVKNLKDNLMMSDSARERNLLFLQYLDYNRFSRSAKHREIVRALRNGEVKSWQGIGEKMLREGDPEALKYFAGRPGYLIRMLNRLLTLGYAREAIEDVLLPAADQVSGHLIMRTVRTLSERRAEMYREHQRSVKTCRDRFEREKVGPFLDLWPVRWAADSKRREAKEKWFDRPAREIREKVYGPYRDLTGCLDMKKRELKAQKDLLARLDGKRINRHLTLKRNAGHDFDPELIAGYPETDPAEALRARINDLKNGIAALEKEIGDLRQRIGEAGLECRQEYLRLFGKMREMNTPAYEAAMEECEAFEEEETQKAQARHLKALAEHAQAMRTLPERKEAALQELEKQYRDALNRTCRDDEIVGILSAVLKEHFRLADTPLRGKKIFVDMAGFDLEHSTLETEDRSKEGGYIRSGICFRIPESARFVRFFVYWNDRKRVDIDLHASGLTIEGQPLHIGWNGDLRDHGVVHSGDITHSDAAEYIDIDLAAPIGQIRANIHLYFGRPSFRAVETCYVGLMAVRSIGQDVRHYDPKNCFFTHRLTQNGRGIQYGCIDVRGRYVRFVGRPDEWASWSDPDAGSDAPAFSLKDYLDVLLESQGTVRVSSKAEADIVLTMGKSGQENGLSLVDHNFFLES
ncbi:MAG: hypothetical protein IJR97_08040 [Clostridia bacterium]|nr:hypothetical protein [Clostridia bacterium]